MVEEIDASLITEFLAGWSGCMVKRLLAEVIIVIATLFTLPPMNMVDVARAGERTTEAGHIRELSEAARLRTYPLNVDFRTARNLQFVQLSPGRVGILSLWRDRNSSGVQIDDFIGRKVFSVGEAKRLFPQNDGFTYPPKDPNLGWMLDVRGSHAVWIDGHTKVSFVTPTYAGEDAINYHGDYFGESCLDPAASYVEIDRDGIIEDKVLFYVFQKPIPLTPSFRCEDELFAPPHATTQIIDPVLIAAKLPSGRVLLAGASYVAMPVVISIPPDFSLPGNGSTLFVVDKREVDRIRQSAADEYQSIERAADAAHKLHPDKFPLKEFTGAGLAALIERRLLEYLHVGEK